MAGRSLVVQPERSRLNSPSQRASGPIETVSLPVKTGSGMQRFGVLTLSVFLFALFGRPFDLFLNSFHIPLVLSLLALSAIVFGGRLSVVFANPTAKLLALLTGWLCISAPLGVWPGGSISLLREEWFNGCMSFVLVVGLTGSSPDAKRLYKAIAYGMLFAALMALAYDARDWTGRLMLPVGQYSNPNDLAYAMTLGLPLWWMIIRDSTAATWLRVLGTFALAPLLLAAFESGSRAGLLAIVVGCLYLVWTLTWSQRLKMMVAGFVLVAVVLATSPTNVLMERIRGTGASEGSSDMRIELLKDSLVLTARNPVFGVGPGMFAVAQNEIAKNEGALKGTWHVTHNTYTELSSEAGLPALALFLLMLYCFYRDLRKIRRLNLLIRTNRQGEIAALCTGSLIVLVSLAACFFFGSLAYSPITLTLIGLFAAYTRVALGELERAESLARANQGPRLTSAS